MVTQKMDSNLKPKPQLDPEEIKLRLNRGAILLNASDNEEYELLVNSYRLASGAPSDYQNAAKMYWTRDRFNKKLVVRMPWSVMLELSRPTKPVDVREMLSDLCMWWIEAKNEGRTPSPYTFPPEKSLILAIVDHPDIYREDLRVLHAKAKNERGLPYTDHELEFAFCPTPDLINRVRTDRSIVVSKSVDLAIQEIAKSSSNGKVSELVPVEQNNGKVQEALEAVQSMLEGWRNEDNQIIVTSLRNHANTLERQLTNALQVIEEINSQNEELRQEVFRLNGIETDNAKLREALADIKAGIDLIAEKYYATSQQIVVVDNEGISPEPLILEP